MSLELLIALATLAGAAMSGLAAFFGLPFLLKRKFDAAIAAYLAGQRAQLELDARKMVEGQIAEHLGDYHNKLSAYETFLPRSEWQEQRNGWQKELHFLRRMIVAIARKLQVSVDDDDG